MYGRLNPYLLRYCDALSAEEGAVVVERLEAALGVLCCRDPTAAADLGLQSAEVEEEEEPADPAEVVAVSKPAVATSRTDLLGMEGG